MAQHYSENAPESPMKITGKTTEFPCAQCGAQLRFDPQKQMLRCEYCGHENIIDPYAQSNLNTSQKGSSEAAAQQQSAQSQDSLAHLKEIDFREALKDELSQAESETTQIADCQACGAKVEFDQNIHAKECPFCASPIVQDTGEHRHFKPAAIAPFTISESEAKTAMRRWLETRWFAPNTLSQYARKDRHLSGIYLPYWTFDAATDTYYQGRRGDIYYVSRTVTVQTDNGPVQRTQRVPQTRWSSRKGHVRRHFDDVLICASHSLPNKHLSRIDRWDLHALLPYRRDYLSGFRAEAYTIDLEQGFEAAKGTMALLIKRDVKFDIGGDKQIVEHLSTQYDAVTFKHILLPIWVAAYRYRGKPYRCVINGRSGEITGERPFSPFKIAAALLAGLTLSLCIAYFYVQYMQ